LVPVTYSIGQMNMEVQKLKIWNMELQKSIPFQFDTSQLTVLKLYYNYWQLSGPVKKNKYCPDML
jgi:peptide methionine sulfoxide reductase MsrA